MDIAMQHSVNPRGLTNENGLLDPAVPFPMIVILVGMVVVVIGAILREVLAKSSIG
jgi:hypothetical protein